MDYPRIHAPLLFYRGGLQRYLCGWVCVGNAVSQTSSLVPPVCRHCTPPGSCAAQDPELYRTYVGLGKPAAARNTDSFVGEMQTKVGTWCSQCRNQRPKNCTKAKKSEKRSTPTAADDEERSSGRKAAAAAAAAAVVTAAAAVTAALRSCFGGARCRWGGRTTRRRSSTRTRQRSS